MDPNATQGEPMVIIKPAPFYKSIKFLTGIGVLVFLLISFSLYNFFKKSLPSQQIQLAEKQSIKPLRGLVGIVQAIDTNKNMITVKSKDEKPSSYQVSNDVLISQLVLGAKSNEEMKQFSMPSETVYLEDLAKKKGAEVYLVFDSKGQKVIQIQMYPKGSKK